MKKLIKILKIFIIGFLILIIGGIGALYLFFPQSKIKAMAQDYVRTNYNRELDFDSVSFALIGVKIHNFRISETGTFDAGTFAEAAQAVVKADVLPLLSGKVNIKKITFDGVKVNIIKEKDGKFNFDNFISGSSETTQEAQSESSTNSNIDILADYISLKNSSFNYLDKETGMDFSINNLNLGIKDFSLNEFFTFALDLETSLDMGEIKLNPLVLNLKGRANLENLNLDQAYIDIEPLILAYKNARIVFKGQVKNFSNPLLNLEGQIEGINNKVITSIMPMDLPAFTLPSANLTVKANADLDNSKVAVTKADLMLGKSYIKNELNLDFASQELSYKAKTVFEIALTDISKIVKEMLKDYALKGTLSGSLETVSANPYPKVKGKVSLNNLGALILDRELKNFNGVITLKSIQDIKTNVMSGVYNDSNFVTSLAYSKPGKPVNIDFMLDLDKFTLDDINFDDFFKAATPAEEAAAAAQKEQEAAAKADGSSDFGIYNIKADIKVKEVANNVLTANDLILKADLQNFADDLSNLQGSLNFSSANGEIRDINKLMQSSKIIKAAFAVVKVIQNVFSLAKLEKLSLGNNNKINYSLIEGVYTVKNGLINLDKSTIVSNLLTVKASGTIDLATEKLNMKVNTHFGKVSSGSGFKPVVLKIKGTMSEPKYSVDMVSTVTSLSNVPVNVLKGGVKMSTNTASGVASGIKGVANSIGKLF